MTFSDMFLLAFLIPVHFKNLANVSDLNSKSPYKVRTACAYHAMLILVLHINQSCDMI